jgi:hypothetical protein
MLDIFARIFGPHRGVSIYVFLQRRGLIFLALAGFIGIVALLLLFTGPEEHRPVGFMTATVISSRPLSASGGNGIMADLRLPDGEEIRVTTTENEVAKTVTDTACIEKRRFIQSGEFRYRIKLPRFCIGQ